MSGTVRALAVLGLLLVASYARAEPDARPWAIGVSDADQARALDLFGRGNALLEQDQYAPALEMYRQALAVWDHPAIHHAAAVTLINLERPGEAYDELERALRYPGALEPDILQQAIQYQRLLQAQIVHLSIECVDPGTRITLDGNDLAVPCPGSARRTILPGRHHLIATKPGYLTSSIDLVPSGGEERSERIDLMTIEEATVTRRRWPRWKPWVVVGASAVVSAVGLGFELQSAATFRSYDNAVAVLCRQHPCASLPSVVADASGEARTENHVAIGLFVTAGATLATGVVLLWLDRAVSEHLGYLHATIPTATIGRGESTIGVRTAF